MVFHSAFVILVGATFLYVGVLGSVPSTLSFGGLFSPFQADGSRGEESIQQLAAFVMAVNEINNKTDGIFDSLLPDTELKIIVEPCINFRDTVAAVEQMTEVTHVSGNVGVSASIMALDSHISAWAAKLFTESKTVVANSLFLGEQARGAEEEFPYNMQITPESHMQGHALQSLLCREYAVQSIAVISLTSDMGALSYDNLVDHKFCSLSILVHQVFNDDITEDHVHEEMTAAFVNDNAEVFVLMLDGRVGSMVMLEGYKQGLFRTGRQIFGTEEMLTADFMTAVGADPVVDTVDMLRGLIVVQHFPEYHAVMTSGDANGFVSRWRKQAPTAGASLGVCDTSTDDGSPSNYLYRNDDGSVCSGLNFSSFATDGSDIAAHVTATYDAVLLLALGVHHLFYTVGNTTTPVHADNLRASLITMDHFAGASGDVAMNAVNIRHRGNTYRLLNFNEEAYEADASVSSAFVLVGWWEATRNVTWCTVGVDATCHTVKYNTHGDGSVRPTGYGPYKSASMPAVLKIGGFFGDVNSLNGFDSPGSQHFASFLMAIKEINNKTDGVWDDVLPETQLVLSVHRPHGWYDALSTAERSNSDDFGGSGVDVGFSALGAEETAELQDYFTVMEKFMIHSVARNAEFSDGIKYPYKVQTSPASTYDGMVLQSFVCNFFQDVNRVVVIAQNNYYGTNAVVEFNDGAYCDINMLGVEYIKEHDDEIDDVMESLKLLGGRYFVLFFSEPADLVNVYTAGHRLGLFHEGTQIISADLAADQRVLDAVTDEAVVKEALKGMFTFTLDANHFVTRSDEGKAFVDRFRAQPSTTGEYNVATGRMDCPTIRDDNGISFLYRTGETLVEDFVCTGLNFSAFAPDGSDLAPSIAQTYDAAFVLADGLHRMLQQVNDSVDSSLLRDIIIDETDFLGASGHVDIYEGMSWIGDYSRGGREMGLMYNVLNFQIDSTGNGALQHVGYYSDETGPLVTETTQMNSKDGQQNDDMQEDIMITMSMSMKGVLYVMFAILLFLIGICVLTLVVYRKQKMIRASQPGMLNLMLLGSFLGALQVLNTTFDISDASCEAGLWFGHCGFVLLFGTLLLKCWRVHAIVNNSGMKRKKISEKLIVSVTLSALLFVCVYLLMMTFVGQIHYSEKRAEVANQDTVEVECRFVHPETHLVLFMMEACVLLVGSYLCYKTKDVPDVVNEAKPIAAATMVIFVLCILVFPLVFVIGLDPVNRQFVVALSIALSIISTLMILFLPKLHVLYTRSHLSRGNSARILSKQEPDDREKPAKEAQRQVYDSTDVDKMSIKDAIDFAQLQIAEWTAAHFRFQERQFGAGSSYSSYHSVERSAADGDEEELQCGAVNSKTSTVLTSESNIVSVSSVVAANVEKY
jgi:hypothetical protein